MRGRFTKRLSGLNTLSYSRRLKLLNLPSLELRRLHVDLIWCYKIIFGIVELAYDDFFKLSPSSITRCHAYKLYKPDSNSAARSHFFARRVINAWNSLPLSTDFRNINVFKHSLFNAGLTKFLVGNTWLAQSVIVFLYICVLAFLYSVFLLFITLITWCSCQCTVCLASPRGFWLVYCWNFIVHCIILEIKWWWWYSR